MQHRLREERRVRADRGVCDRNSALFFFFLTEREKPAAITEHGVYRNQIWPRERERELSEKKKKCYALDKKSTLVTVVAHKTSAE